MPVCACVFDWENMLYTRDVHSIIIIREIRKFRAVVSCIASTRIA